MCDTIEGSVSNLLESIGKINNHFSGERQKTGKGFNIFKISGQAERERVICRVIANLLNPQGDHAQKSRFLRLFWEMVSPKIENCPVLDFENAVVSLEYRIDNGRRIDIVINDEMVFVPIEVKIWAKDQYKQVSDYALYSRTKNKHYKMPVLYITTDGKTANNTKIIDYVSISFTKDIISWLENCTRGESSLPTSVLEPINQFIDAVKYFCGITEDDPEMEEIFKTITQSEEQWLQAVKIRDAVNTMYEDEDRIYSLFKGIILENVQKVIPEAEWYEDGYWYSIAITLSHHSEKYNFHINYDWRSATLWAHNKKNITSQDGKALSQKMSELFGATDNGDDEHAVWTSDEISWPAFASVREDDSKYFYRIYKLYSEHPQEVADKIISIFRELEKV